MVRLQDFRVLSPYASTSFAVLATNHGVIPAKAGNDIK